MSGSVLYTPWDRPICVKVDFLNIDYIYKYKYNYIYIYMPATEKDILNHISMK